MATTDEFIGRRIESLRQDRDETQTEFATFLRDNGLNWSQGTLSKVEQGQRSVRLVEAYQIAAILGTSLNKLGFAPPSWQAIDLDSSLRDAERNLKLQHLSYLSHKQEFERISAGVSVLRAMSELKGNNQLALHVHGMDWVDLICVAADAVGNHPETYNAKFILDELGVTNDLREGFADDAVAMYRLEIGDVMETVPTYEELASIAELAGSSYVRARSLTGTEQNQLLDEVEFGHLTEVLAVLPLVPELLQRFPNVAFGPFVEGGPLLYFGTITDA